MQQYPDIILRCRGGYARASQGRANHILCCAQGRVTVPVAKSETISTNAGYRAQAASASGKWHTLRCQATRPLNRSGVSPSREQPQRTVEKAINNHVVIRQQLDITTTSAMARRRFHVHSKENISHRVVPKSRRVLRKERLTEVLWLLHPATSARCSLHHPRRRGCRIPVPLLVFLVLHLKTLVFDLRSYWAAPDHGDERAASSLLWDKVAMHKKHVTHPGISACRKFDKPSTHEHPTNVSENTDRTDSYNNNDSGVF